MGQDVMASPTVRGCVYAAYMVWLAAPCQATQSLTWEPTSDTGLAAEISLGGTETWSVYILGRQVAELTDACEIRYTVLPPVEEGWFRHYLYHEDATNWTRLVCTVRNGRVAGFCRCEMQGDHWTGYLLLGRVCAQPRFCPVYSAATRGGR